MLWGQAELSECARACSADRVRGRGAVRRLDHHLPAGGGPTRSAAEPRAPRANRRPRPSPVLDHWWRAGPIDPTRSQDNRHPPHSRGRPYQHAVVLADRFGFRESISKLNTARSRRRNSPMCLRNDRIFRGKSLKMPSAPFKSECRLTGRVCAGPWSWCCRTCALKRIGGTLLGGCGFPPFRRSGTLSLHSLQWNRTGEPL